MPEISPLRRPGPISPEAFDQLRVTRQGGPDDIRAALADRIRRPLVRDDGRRVWIRAAGEAR